MAEPFGSSLAVLRHWVPEPFGHERGTHPAPATLSTAVALSRADARWLGRILADEVLPATLRALQVMEPGAAGGEGEARGDRGCGTSEATMALLLAVTGREVLLGVVDRLEEVDDGAAGGVDACEHDVTLDASAVLLAVQFAHHRVGDGNARAHLVEIATRAEALLHAD